MNTKLSGIIFIIFGIGLLSDSAFDLYNNSIGLNFESVKSVLLFFLAISSCIYGYKQMTQKNESLKEKSS